MPEIASQTKVLRGVDGRHLNRRHWRDALGDGVSYDAVHVSVLGQCLGMRVIRAENEVS